MFGHDHLGRSGHCWCSFMYISSLLSAAFLSLSRILSDVACRSIGACHTRCKDNTSKDPFSQCENLQHLQGIHIQVKSEYLGTIDNKWSNDTKHSDKHNNMPNVAANLKHVNTGRLVSAVSLDGELWDVILLVLCHRLSRQCSWILGHTCEVCESVLLPLISRRAPLRQPFAVLGKFPLSCSDPALPFHLPHPRDSLSHLSASTQLWIFSSSAEHARCGHTFLTDWARAPRIRQSATGQCSCCQLGTRDHSGNSQSLAVTDASMPFTARSCCLIDANASNSSLLGLTSIRMADPTSRLSNTSPRQHVSAQGPCERRGQRVHDPWSLVAPATLLVNTCGNLTHTDSESSCARSHSHLSLSVGRTGTRFALTRLSSSTSISPLSICLAWLDSCSHNCSSHGVTYSLFWSFNSLKLLASRQSHNPFCWLRTPN